MPLNPNNQPTFQRWTMFLMNPEKDLQFPSDMIIWSDILSVMINYFISQWLKLYAFFTSQGYLLNLPWCETPIYFRMWILTDCCLIGYRGYFPLSVTAYIYLLRLKFWSRLLALITLEMFLYQNCLLYYIKCSLRKIENWIDFIDVLYHQGLFYV